MSMTLDRVIDAIVRIDLNWKVTFVSEPGLRWFGYGSSDNIPDSFADMLYPDDTETFRDALVDSPESFSCDLRVLREGRESWTNVRGFLLADATQFMMCFIDITSWKTQDSVLRHAAEHDELTGLPNRALLKRTVDSLIQRGIQPFTVALLDLDGFKKVNDTFGHAIGDAVLIETTRRLTKLIGPDDMLARLGGDEFVIVLVSTDAEQAASRLSSVLLAVARPFDTAPHNAYLGVSIGITEYPTHGSDYSTLLKNADMAMYQAKNGGKNRISIYVESNDSVDFSIRAAIHRGIHEGEFYLEFQPQYDINRRLVGAEALMRWTSGSFGRMAPDKFIPIVEESGLMSFLGRWALRYACHQLRTFHELMPDFIMSVNVSPIQFGGDGFDGEVLEAIAEAGVDPARVILEITESTLMRSQAKTERALARLREHGIRFSIDDFGTGFSSLAYLTRLPVSSIKIDKAFIRAIEDASANSLSDRKLITAMINLAHSIDLKVVAEGVENEGQFGFLEQAGCNLIQGYLLGKPMPGHVLHALLNTQARAAA